MADRDSGSPSFAKPRQVVEKVLAIPKDANGTNLTICIGSGPTRNFDPFPFMFEFSVSGPAADHPHRGFEAVTYMLEGAFKHQDVSGYQGTIKAGDLLWMTAGRGIIHSEIAGAEGEHSKGLQLWINLPSKDKMMEPKYLEVKNKDVSRAEKDGVEVRVIAGEALGVRTPPYTVTPVMLLDFTLQPGAKVHQPVPESWNSFVYVIEGDGVFGNPDAPPATGQHTLLLSTGDGLSAWNQQSAKPLRFLLVAGEPLKEPIVHSGPFVMNTDAEIQQAFEDYNKSQNGFEKAKHSISQ